MNRRRWTYADAGVDVKQIKSSQRDLAELFRRTFRNREGKTGSVLEEIGHYAGLIDMGGETALALHTDGVGTKVLVAQMMNKFDTIGIDCVAMNVNDIICVGAEPISFLDYIALKKLDDELIKEITKGLILGADEASVAIIGGETAVVPDLLKGEGDKAFDLVGMALGIIDKKHVITGERIRKDDVVIGVESSGIHSNGLTLARKVLMSKYKMRDYVPSLGKSLGDELLKPTKIYVKPVLEILRNRIDVSGLAHITGGGFSKLTRLIRGRELGFMIDAIPESSAIFKLIQREGSITKREMYRAFNMGIGFCIMAPISELKAIENIFRERGTETHVIGRVTEGSGVFVDKTKIV
ncbi:MAG: phosphoribosylformylglycinamidine cyclo-ligase [Nitrososphaerales archaeon]